MFKLNFERSVKLNRDHLFSTYAKFSNKLNVKYDTFKAKIHLFLFKQKQVNLGFKSVTFNLSEHFPYLLTLFFPMFPFDPPENIRKPKVF